MLTTEAASPHVPSTLCASCGAVLNGLYCAACGQRRLDDHSFALSHFLDEFLHETVHFDGKIVHTLKALFTKPGLLTQEYWAGRQTAWVRPLRLFLIVVAVHFLLIAGVGPFNFALAAVRLPSGNVSLAVGPDPTGGAAFRARGTPLPPEAEVAIRDEFRHTYASLRYFIILFFALASWALYRKAKPYFVQHLVAGLHFGAFWFASSLLVGPLVPRWPILEYLLRGIFLVYCFLMVRRLYRQGFLASALKSVVLVAVMFAADQAVFLASLTATQTYIRRQHLVDQAPPVASQRAEDQRGPKLSGSTIFKAFGA
jgi:hypothetical protein